MKSVIIVSAQSEACNFAVQTSKIRVANTYVLQTSIILKMYPIDYEHRTVQVVSCYVWSTCSVKRCENS